MAKRRRLLARSNGSGTKQIVLFQPKATDLDRRRGRKMKTLYELRLRVGQRQIVGWVTKAGPHGVRIERKAADELLAMKLDWGPRFCELVDQVNREISDGRELPDRHNIGHVIECPLDEGALSALRTTVRDISEGRVDLVKAADR